MLIKNYSRISSYRRRHCLSRIIIIILGVCLFVQIKYNLFFSLPNEIPLNNISCGNLLFSKPILNCSGDPLKTWCENEVKLCDSCLIVYNKLFILTHSVILQPEFAKGKRIGGENIQDVLNQPESDEYFHFEKEFIKVKSSLLFIILK
jgi:hypothetical protein